MKLSYSGGHSPPASRAPTACSERDALLRCRDGCLGRRRGGRLETRAGGDASRVGLTAVLSIANFVLGLGRRTSAPLQAKDLGSTRRSQGCGPPRAPGVGTTRDRARPAARERAVGADLKVAPRTEAGWRPCSQGVATMIANVPATRTMLNEVRASTTVRESGAKDPRRTAAAVSRWRTLPITNTNSARSP